MYPKDTGEQMLFLHHVMEDDQTGQGLIVYALILVLVGFILIAIGLALRAALYIGLAFLVDLF